MAPTIVRQLVDRAGAYGGTRVKVWGERAASVCRGGFTDLREEPGTKGSS